MDAHAHLLSLGWAGPGHSLDSRPYKQTGHRGLAYDPSKVGNNGGGLVRPLLVSQRQGRLGVGKKAHEPPAGNEWWLKGFESALGNIGKSESERSSGTATPVSHDYNGGKHGGLYRFFTKGQAMEGTIGKERPPPATSSNSKKRKSDVLDEDTEDEAANTAVSEKKKGTVAEFEQVETYLAICDQEKRRLPRSPRPDPAQEFRQVTEFLEFRAEKEKKKSKRKSRVLSPESNTPTVEEGAVEGTETKEERRERRRRRREEKEQRRNAVAQQGNGTALSPPAVLEEDEAARAARRTERKKRKAEKKGS